MCKLATNFGFCNLCNIACWILNEANNAIKQEFVEVDWTCLLPSLKFHTLHTTFKERNPKINNDIVLDFA